MNIPFGKFDVELKFALDATLLTASGMTAVLAALNATFSQRLATGIVKGRPNAKTGDIPKTLVGKVVLSDPSPGDCGQAMSQIESCFEGCLRQTSLPLGDALGDEEEDAEDLPDAPLLSPRGKNPFASSEWDFEKCLPR